MNVFVATGLIVAMIGFPAIYFAGLMVIKTWAWRYLSRKLLIALAMLFGLTVATWALAFFWVIQNFSGDASDGLCFILYFPSSILLAVMCIDVAKAIDALKKDVRPVSFSEVAKQALKK